MAIVDDEELVASAVIYPGSTEEVQKVVYWANKYLIPLHPISMGRNCTLSLCPKFSTIQVSLTFTNQQLAMVELHHVFVERLFLTWASV